MINMLTASAVRGFANEEPARGAKSMKGLSRPEFV
jgi:hypothetical protein